MKSWLVSISDRKRLSGILGALSKRVIATQGYFKEHKPGLKPLFYQEPGLSPNNRRWFLRPEMCQALKELDPDWLVPQSLSKTEKSEQQFNDPISARFADSLTKWAGNG